VHRSDFEFNLPPELIAQEPIAGERDQSRLMVLDRSRQTIAHRRFFELPEYLQPGDLLVFNDTKVFPARLLGRKADTKGSCELLLLRPRPDRRTNEDGGECWEAMVRSRRTTAGQAVIFPGETGLRARLLERISNETWLIQFSLAGEAFRQALEILGQTPIPPYIKHSPLSESDLRRRYQTVYARQEGSAAAPTAGLHFTDRLLAELRGRGIATAALTLHVGLGTFAPVRTENLAKHRMHAEYAELPAETAAAVQTARRLGHRVLAVGTTTARALESFTSPDGETRAGQQWTEIFMTPGYSFRCIDGLITNFHLPGSTLLMLVAAFAGLEFTKTAYDEAVAQQYRFYSFGDAMLIL
jgi:S-adenosylmethionine:tRNA ribosyltransferase-isomerase